MESLSFWLNTCSGHDECVTSLKGCRGVHLQILTFCLKPIDTVHELESKEKESKKNKE